MYVVNTLARLPSEMDITVVRKEGIANPLQNFHVRQSVVRHALQWLIVNSKYYNQLRSSGNAA